MSNPIRVEILEEQGRLKANFNMQVSEDPYYTQKIEAMVNGLRALASSAQDNPHLRNSVLADANILNQHQNKSPKAPSMAPATRPAFDNAG